MIAVLGSSSAFASEPRRVMGVGGRERGKRHGGGGEDGRYVTFTHAKISLLPHFSPSPFYASRKHIFSPPPFSQLEFRRLDRKFPGHQGKEKLKVVETLLKIAPNFRLPSREESDK